MNVQLLSRLTPVAILLLGLVLFFALGLERHLSFETLSRNHTELAEWVAANNVLAAVAFVAAYAAVVAFSLPVSALVTAVSGFLFGTWLGAVLSIAGATLGAMALFLVARSAFYDLFHARAGAALKRLEEGFKRDAFSYLLFLRLVPIFPFWLVNIVAALLGMRFRSFVLATVIGIVPGGVVFASIGAGFGMLFETGQAPDLGVIFQAPILLPLVGLGVLSLVPVLYRRFRRVRTRH